MSFSFRAGTLNLVESKGSGGGVVKRILKADSRKGLISVNSESIIWSPMKDGTKSEQLSYPCNGGEFVQVKGCLDGVVFHLKRTQLFLWLQDSSLIGKDIVERVNCIINGTDEFMDQTSIQNLLSLSKFRELKDSFDFESLYPLLPEGSPRNSDEIESIINSIPFKQCLDFIESTFDEGDLGPLLHQLGIDNPSKVRDLPSLMRAFKKKK